MLKYNIIIYQQKRIININIQLERITPTKKRNESKTVNISSKKYLERDEGKKRNG